MLQTCQFVIRDSKTIPFDLEVEDQQTILLRRRREGKKRLLKNLATTRYLRLKSNTLLNHSDRDDYNRRDTSGCLKFYCKIRIFKKTLFITSFSLVKKAKLYLAWSYNFTLFNILEKVVWIDICNVDGGSLFVFIIDEFNPSLCQGK
jgi:hypothetical protein